ncbi:LolA family protein [Pseudarthrobacter sp. L19]|uniref:LolA family protein n=1 Tax=Pseudarthrobacter sp. L19 TaxID=3423951 RepID=UPI003D79E915
MTRTWLRWMPAAVVPAVIAAGVLAGSVPASAKDPLPSKTPAEVIALMAGQHQTAFSGTLDQASSLGLPQLPTTGPGSSPETAWLELLTGPHTARVYRDGPGNLRVQVLDRLAERDVIRRGNDLWLYSSKDNSAAHAVIPADAGHHGMGKGASSGADSGTVPTPDALAAKLLAALEPTSDVAVAPEVSVAGRSAYQLVLTPKSSDTLMASAAIMVDGQTGLPLGVELKARGQADPAFRVTFGAISLTAPDSGIFQFTPPAGASIKELPVQDHSGQAAHKPSGTGKDPQAGKRKVSGGGWDSVLELPAGTLTPPAAGTAGATAGNAAALLQQAAVPVAGGRLLSTALLNVLILDDGRVFLGSVPLARLQAAAGGQ